MKRPFRSSTLSKIKPIPFHRLLYRGIRMNTLLSQAPPEPLFVSGAKNRYNFADTRTLYFGGNFVTAYAETVQKHAALLIEHPTREEQTGAEVDLVADEPIVLFGVKASLSKVLDLTDVTVGHSLEFLKIR